MPEQHDPIEELARFGADLPGGTMPMSAADVRRRGDQIRRRRTALVAGGAALAVAAVTVPVFALIGTGSDRSDRELPATDPKNTRSLSADDLLTDSDTVYNQRSDWFTTDTFEGDGQAAFHRCARESLSGLGATAIHQRDYEMRAINVQPGDVPDTARGKYNHFREAIAEFPDAASAAAAYDTIADWINDCTEQMAAIDKDYRAINSYDADTGLDGDTAAQIIDAHYGPAPEEIDPFGDEAFIAETGLVRVDNRIAVLDSVIVGQDYNFLPEEGGTPVNRMIPVAAERLQPGT